MTDTVRAVGLAGSLRSGSYNKKLLRATIDLAPEGCPSSRSIGSVHFPFYDDDLAGQGDPEAVAALKAAVADADAVVIATPEYNFGLPGVLKNALDWLSLPPGRSPLANKTAAIMGATPGMLGTARAQMHLRQLFVFTRTTAVLQPEVLVAHADAAFDDDGQLIDPITQKLLDKLLTRLVELTVRLR